MNVLAFDTCFGACSVAVSADAGTPGQRLFHAFERMETGQAERLLPMISDVLAQARLSMADIDQIGVTTGPGTFTGTRIAVAAAKGLALARQIPVTGLSSLAIMARQAAVEAPQSAAICVVVDVRRNEVYAQHFDPTGLMAKTPPALLTLDQVRELAGLENIIFVGNGASLVAPLNAPQPYGCSMSPELLPDARYAIDVLSHGVKAASAISPLYLRQPDAKPAAPSRLERR